MYTEQTQPALRIDFDWMLNQVFNSIYAGVSITNKDGFILAANDIFCVLYGKKRSEIINQHFCTLIPKEHHELANELHREFMNGNLPEIHDEWHVLRSDGTFVDIYSTPKLMTGISGEKYKVTTIVNITEYKRLHPCET